MNPGTAGICRHCDHLAREAFEQGHVNPCRLNRWEGTKHLSPALSDDGRACDGFEPQTEEDVDGELVDGAD